MFPRWRKYYFKVLIQEKKSNTEPSNFHPIALQPLLTKIYSFVICNVMYSFLVKNDFIETRTGFEKAYLEQLGI